MSDSSAISPMSRHPDLNRRPTDYEAVRAQRRAGRSLEERRNVKHDSQGQSTTGSRWWFLCLAALALGAA